MESESTVSRKSAIRSLTLRSQDQFFHVQVEDSGPGVSEVGSGPGLSLYIARCIARQYGEKNQSLMESPAVGSVFHSRCRSMRDLRPPIACDYKARSISFCKFCGG
jgi:hypothetical protein